MQFVAAEYIKILLLLSSSQCMPTDSQQILVLSQKLWKNEAAGMWCMHSHGSCVPGSREEQ